jgi:hypothetical protein
VALGFVARGVAEEDALHLPVHHAAPADHIVWHVSDSANRFRPPPQSFSGT